MLKSLEQMAYFQRLLLYGSRDSKQYIALRLIEHRHWRNGHLEEFATAAAEGDLRRELIDLTDEQLEKFLKKHYFDFEG